MWKCGSGVKKVFTMSSFHEIATLDWALGLGNKNFKRKSLSVVSAIQRRRLMGEGPDHSFEIKARSPRYEMCAFFIEHSTKFIRQIKTIRHLSACLSRSRGLRAHHWRMLHTIYSKCHCTKTSILTQSYAPHGERYKSRGFWVFCCCCLFFSFLFYFIFLVRGGSQNFPSVF